MSIQGNSNGACGIWNLTFELMIFTKLSILYFCGDRMLLWIPLRNNILSGHKTVYYEWRPRSKHQEPHSESSNRFHNGECSSTRRVCTANSTANIHRSWDWEHSLVKILKTPKVPDPATRGHYCWGTPNVQSGGTPISVGVPLMFRGDTSMSGGGTLCPEEIPPMSGGGIMCPEEIPPMSGEGTICPEEIPPMSGGGTICPRIYPPMSGGVPYVWR